MNEQNVEGDTNYDKDNEEEDEGESLSSEDAPFGEPVSSVAFCEDPLLTSLARDIAFDAWEDWRFLARTPMENATLLHDQHHTPTEMLALICERTLRVSFKSVSDHCCLCEHNLFLLLPTLRLGRTSCERHKRPSSSFPLTRCTTWTRRSSLLQPASGAWSRHSPRPSR